MSCWSLLHKLCSCVCKFARPKRPHNETHWAWPGKRCGSFGLKKAPQMSDASKSLGSWLGGAIHRDTTTAGLLNRAGPRLGRPRRLGHCGRLVCFSFPFGAVSWPSLWRPLPPPPTSSPPCWPQVTIWRVLSSRLCFDRPNTARACLASATRID